MMRSGWQQRLADCATVAGAAVLSRSWDPVVDAEIVRAQADARYVAAEVHVARMQQLESSLSEERGKAEAEAAQGRRVNAKEAEETAAKAATLVSLRQDALAEMVRRTAAL